MGGTAALAVAALTVGILAAPVGSVEIPTVVCFGQPVTIFARPAVRTVGTEGRDVILGMNDAAGDHIDARGGAYRVCALGGKDRHTPGGKAHNDGFDCGARSDVADGGAGL